MKTTSIYFNKLTYYLKIFSRETFSVRENKIRTYTITVTGKNEKKINSALDC